MENILSKNPNGSIDVMDRYGFTEYTVEVKQEKLDIIKINLSKLDMAKIQEIMVRYNVTSFNDAELVPSKCLDEILDLI